MAPVGRAANEISSLSRALTFHPSIPDYHSFDTKTETTTRGCGGGCSKVRFGAERGGPIGEEKKIQLAVSPLSFFSFLSSSTAASLFSLGHIPSRRPTPFSRLFLPNFLTKGEFVTRSVIFIGIEAKLSAQRVDTTGQSENGQRCNSGSPRAFRSRSETFRLSGERKRVSLLPLPIGTRLPQERGPLFRI